MNTTESDINDIIEKKISDKSIKTSIVHSFGTNPWYNLALEEYLLQQIEEEEVVLYLWQNQNTVVIGRNQNAWKECRCQLLQDEGGKLARRLSGGGAVFHDLGNLNFTFLTDKKLYNQKLQLKVILEAVNNLGLAAQFSGRNDLIIDDRKFSGNAFYHGTGACYHHGTILVDTDFTKLVKYLQVSEEKIRSKGVESVRSRVINLSEIKPELTIDSIKRAMEESFIEFYGGNPEIKKIDPGEFSEIEDLYQKYSSWEWCFGRTPDFDIALKHRFDWGEVELGLTLANGQIAEATIYSDAMDADLIEEIADRLTDNPFHLKDIIKSVESISTDSQGEEVIKDLSQWLQTRDVF